ncbi:MULTISPECIES: cytochrome d ubiquinol oxidase subunit II [Mycobacteriaceae]|uniref:Cytochrome d ubiquinol oxidase subunit II n=1 Tax=Mycolicibacterium parafortuitum TaxID=39692 RepID=A0ACC6MPS0_MYCPF|nr:MULTISPECIES: cytochrome d ubiquinol oxidase subunit II [Mycobacteriaceae]MDZ5088915.1 cytochrome d ubiquinol oxidase subunit II [Mycolicibacterium parafortuitum]GFM20584.1 integral membrane cytochrome D ubiquinol oxidase subunit II cydB [Mycobacterium sp. PO1]GFM26727.1 integral membrane cytochrome D ubiquinol oxidase subunit II cydB [Mycobacterium sp. PO2]
MGLQELWFFLIAALFLGFLILEGFDFGVGMLMIPFGAASKNIEGGGHDTAERHRRAALNTIGPVWDGNEVWLITAGAAMFAAFPVWYATVFSALYLPLLAILFGMIVRIVGIEWRGKIDDPKWRDWADIGIALGSWLPAILWGVAFAVLVQGLPIDADGASQATLYDVVNPYTLLGGLATASLFAFYGSTFVALKTSGEIRDNAFRFARILTVPVIALAGGFGLWTQLAHGKSWTWLALAAAVVALLVAVALMWSQSREGWAFFSTVLVVASVAVLIFGSLYPNLLPSTLNPEWSVTIFNGSSTPYTLKIMSWASLTLLPLVLGYQAWSYWVFRKRISADSIPESIGLSRRSS